MCNATTIRRLFLLSILYSLLSTLLIGCATSPARIGSQLERAVLIDGGRYIPAESICQIYNLDYSWDPITKKAILKKDDKELKLLVDSSTALLNNTVRSIDREVRFFQGKVLIPQSFTQRNLYRFFREEAFVRETVSPRWGFPIKSVIIDPGHGGTDPGAIGRGGLREKDVVLDIAKRLARELKACGIKVVMTRDSDKLVSLSRRSKVANTREKDTDFFISIHANASRSKWISGVEVFYLSESIDDNMRSYQAAKNYNLNLKEDYFGQNTAAIIWDLKYTENRRASIQLANFVAQTLSESLSQRNRGTKPARFYVLKGTNMPAVLVEVGFISNIQEEKKLTDASYRDKIAQTIAEGIAQYNRHFSQRYTVRH